jgi:hypothetical protein
MEIIELSKSDFWLPGASIWVTTLEPGNQWRYIFDYKLNFQISRLLNLLARSQSRQFKSGTQSQSEFQFQSKLKDQTLAQSQAQTQTQTQTKTQAQSQLENQFQTQSSLGLNKETGELLMVAPHGMLPAELVVLIETWHKLEQIQKIHYPYQSTIVRLFNADPKMSISRSLSSKFQFEVVYRDE